MLLVGLDAEDEAPIVFLRLRKAARSGLRVFSVAPFASTGVTKTGGTLLPTVPGAEAAVLTALASPDGSRWRRGRGRRAAARARCDRACGRTPRAPPGALSAAARLADATGARLGWVPRRAGERGALDAGALSGLLPGGRPLADAAARQQAADVWGVGVDSPAAASRARPRGVVAALQPTPRPSPPRPTRAPSTARCGRCSSRGVEAVDLADPAGFLAALRGRAVRRLARAAPLRGHRARRRRPAGRRGRREVRHVPRLGGPPAPVRRRSSQTR